MLEALTMKRRGYHVTTYTPCREVSQRNRKRIGILEYPYGEGIARQTTRSEGTMAQFRGGIRGQRGEVTRLGSKNSGLNVWANTWASIVDVQLYHEDGADKVRVTLAPWRSGSGRMGSGKVLYDGPAVAEAL